jgi:hypothetical protein
MPLNLPWGKKPWEKCMCSFELQEYGGDGGKGWHSITEPTGTPISKQESKEFFKPDRHYRVIARALEGEQAGRFIGVVWDYYEPYRGLLKKEEEEKREKAPPKPKEVEDVIGEWADKVDKVLEPVEKIMDTMDRIRGRFEPASKGESEEGGASSYEIPPPQFDGKLPAIMHPYVVHVIAEEIKGVIDYGTKRIGETFGAFGVGGLPGQPAPKEEEEEEAIPSISKFKEKKKAAEMPPEEEEEAAEEELTIPMPEKEEPEEAPIEEKKEEVVPSLEEKPEEAPKEEEEPLMERLEREELQREYEPEAEEAEAEEEMPSLPKKPRRRKK